MCARGSNIEFSKELRNSPKKVEKKGRPFAEIDISEVLWFCFNECLCFVPFQSMGIDKMAYHSILNCCVVETERTCIKRSVCRYWGLGFSHSKRQFLFPSAGSDFVKKMYKRLVFQDIIEPINIFNLSSKVFARGQSCSGRLLMVQFTVYSHGSSGIFLSSEFLVNIASQKGQA